MSRADCTRRATATSGLRFGVAVSLFGAGLLGAANGASAQTRVAVVVTGDEIADATRSALTAELASDATIVPESEVRAAIAIEHVDVAAPDACDVLARVLAARLVRVTLSATEQAISYRTEICGGDGGADRRFGSAAEADLVAAIVEGLRARFAELSISRAPVLPPPLPPSDQGPGNTPRVAPSPPCNQSLGGRLALNFIGGFQGLGLGGSLRASPDLAAIGCSSDLFVGLDLEAGFAFTDEASQRGHTMRYSFPGLIGPSIRWVRGSIELGARLALGAWIRYADIFAGASREWSLDGSYNVVVGVRATWRAYGQLLLVAMIDGWIGPTMNAIAGVGVGLALD